MKKKRIAINGFGRIGRSVARIILTNYKDKFDIVAINEPGDSHTAIHLFEFDSNFGPFEGTCLYDEEKKEFVINGDRIKSLATKEIESLPWKEMDIDVVIESTGVFTKKEDCEKHIAQGAKKVLLSAPAKGEGFKTIVIGVNDSELKETDLLVSCASCTTNCLAPVVKVLNDTFEIEQGFMTTIHSYTNDQRVLDIAHKDLRRARASGLNMIPTSTGAAKAIGLVIPALDKKMNGVSVRVPTPTVSIVDVVVKVKKPATKESVNGALEEFSKKMPHILGFETRPLVSMDFKKDPRSSIVDSLETMVIGDMVKVFSWYDNEWGYSNRMVDLALKM